MAEAVQWAIQEHRADGSVQVWHSSPALTWAEADREAEAWRRRGRLCTVVRLKAGPQARQLPVVQKGDDA